MAQITNPDADGGDDIQWRSRVRLVDEITELLRNRITHGEYAPGSPLLQERLASELDVSRTPLREAFRILEREGLISVTGGRARVVAGDLQRLLTAYAVREVLDGLGARLAAAHGKDRALTRLLAATIAAQRKSLRPWSPRGYTAKNIAFHRTIYEAADNEYLIAQLPIVAMTAQVFMPVELLVFERATEAVGEHEAISEAIRAGDAEEAERRAREHIHRTVESLGARRGG
jgi:DNA-binding GntR family transcriptional regulator